MAFLLFHFSYLKTSTELCSWSRQARWLGIPQWCCNKPFSRRDGNRSCQGTIIRELSRRNTVLYTTGWYMWGLVKTIAWWLGVTWCCCDKPFTRRYSIREQLLENFVEDKLYLTSSLFFSAEKYILGYWRRWWTQNSPGTYLSKEITHGKYMLVYLFKARPRLHFSSVCWWRSCAIFKTQCYRTLKW